MITLVRVLLVLVVLGAAYLAVTNRQWFYLIAVAGGVVTLIRIRGR